jgi:hypothetical protein
MRATYLQRSRFEKSPVGWLLLHKPNPFSCGTSMGSASRAGIQEESIMNLKSSYGTTRRASNSASAGEWKAGSSVPIERLKRCFLHLHPGGLLDEWRPAREALSSSVSFAGMLCYAMELHKNVGFFPGGTFTYDGAWKP